MIYRPKITYIKKCFFEWIELLCWSLIQGNSEIGCQVWATRKLDVKNKENIVKKQIHKRMFGSLCKVLSITKSL